MSSDIEPDPAQLQSEWEARAQSPYRNFFVASHRGWNDPTRWANQAEHDAALILTQLPWDCDGGIGKIPLRDLDVLEIGCGVGRLAPHIARRVRSYTGFDISPTMVNVAAQSPSPNARFFVTDGASVPSEAADKSYGLVFALAVFIHCPKHVVRSLIAGALPLMTPGGQLRCQLLADASDPDGITTAPQREDANKDGTDWIEDDVDPTATPLVVGTSYKGYEFKYAEANALFKDVGYEKVAVSRFDSTFMYALAEKAL